MKINRAQKKRSPRGQMRPLTPDQVRTIEGLLRQKADWRSLALFRLAIDSMLRASDLISLSIHDVMTDRLVPREEILTRQQKTMDGVRSTLSAETREAVARWFAIRPASYGEWLFPGKKSGEHLTASQYRRDAKDWFRMAHLEERLYSTHSLRRTKAALIFSRTGNVEVVRRLLGHKSVEATSKYLGVEDADALRIARETKI